MFQNFLKNTLMKRVVAFPLGGGAAAIALLAVMRREALKSLSSLEAGAPAMTSASLRMATTRSVHSPRRAFPPSNDDEPKKMSVIVIAKYAL
jgi:hypothetical protein